MGNSWCTSFHFYSTKYLLILIIPMNVFPNGSSMNLTLYFLNLLEYIFRIFQTNQFYMFWTRLLVLVSRFFVTDRLLNKIGPFENKNTISQRWHNTWTNRLGKFPTRFAQVIHAQQIFPRDVPPFADIFRLTIF